MRLVVLALAFAIAIPTSLSAEAVVAKETLVSDKAAGEFDVKIAPVSQADEVLSRFSIDKQYHGDLVATGVGQMMASRDEKAKTGVYVAIETVAGTLKGRKGSFLLAHRGTMSPAGQELSVIITPASGTGELAGISGDLEIILEGGKHSYVLRYTLPAH